MPGRRDGGRGLLQLGDREGQLRVLRLQVDDLSGIPALVDEALVVSALVPDEDADLAAIRHVRDLELALGVGDSGQRMGQRPGVALHPAVDVTADLDWSFGDVRWMD